MKGEGKGRRGKGQKENGDEGRKGKGEEKNRNREVEKRTEEDSPTPQPIPHSHRLTYFLYYSLTSLHAFQRSMVSVLPYACFFMYSLSPSLNRSLPKIAHTMFTTALPLQYEIASNTYSTVHCILV